MSNLGGVGPALNSVAQAASKASSGAKKSKGNAIKSIKLKVKFGGAKKAQATESEQS